MNDDSHPTGLNEDWRRLHALQLDLRQAMISAETDEERAELRERFDANREKLTALEQRVGAADPADPPAVDAGGSADADARTDEPDVASDLDPDAGPGDSEIASDLDPDAGPGDSDVASDLDPDAGPGDSDARDEPHAAALPSDGTTGTEPGNPADEKVGVGPAETDPGVGDHADLPAADDSSPGPDEDPGRNVIDLTGRLNLEPDPSSDAAADTDVDDVDPDEDLDLLLAELTEASSPVRPPRVAPPDDGPPVTPAAPVGPLRRMTTTPRPRRSVTTGARRPPVPAISGATTANPPTEDDEDHDRTSSPDGEGDAPEERRVRPGPPPMPRPSARTTAVEPVRPPPGFLPMPAFPSSLSPAQIAIIVAAAAGLLLAGLSGWLLGASGGDERDSQVATGTFDPTESDADSDDGTAVPDDASDGLSVGADGPRVRPRGDGPLPPALDVAVILVGSAGDMAQSQSVVDAVAVVAAERGAVSVDLDEQVTAGDAAERLAAAADGGADLVIAHGASFESAVIAVAAEHPDVVFAVGAVGEPSALPNVYTYSVAAEEGGYVLGSVAGMITESNVVGVVGSVDTGIAGRYVDGFRAGVEAEDADVRVFVAHTAGADAVGTPEEVADQLLDARADVITGDGPGMTPAIATAADGGARWLGNQVNQVAAAPSAVVASQVYRWEVALRSIVADVDDDEVDGRHLALALANGGLVIDLNPSLRLPTTVEARVEAIVADIIDGSIDPLTRP